MKNKKSDCDIIRDCMAAAAAKHKLSSAMLGHTSAFMLKEEAAGYLLGAVAALQRSAAAEGCERIWRPEAREDAEAGE